MNLFYDFILESQRKEIELADEAAWKEKQKLPKEEREKRENMERELKKKKYELDTKRIIQNFFSSNCSILIDSDLSKIKENQQTQNKRQYEFCHKFSVSSFNEYECKLLKDIIVSYISERLSDFITLDVSVLYNYDRHPRYELGEFLRGNPDDYYYVESWIDVNITLVS